MDKFNLTHYFRLKIVHTYTKKTKKSHIFIQNPPTLGPGFSNVMHKFVSDIISHFALAAFNYPADKDSVLLVNKADYDNCNTASPIEKYSDGHSVVKFNQSGPFYFISGVHDNCVKNEKLHAVVMADRSNRNQTAASPPPSPSADDVPPSPAPSGEEAPSSPTGSVEINPTAAPSQESSPPKNGASSIAVSFVGSTTAFIGSLFLLGF